MSRPWMQFYPADWRSDPRLRLCSRAARGLWIDMLSVMHEATPYGELRIGEVILDASSLARVLGESVDDVSADLFELEQAGVFSRRRNGVIFSRRMVRDEEKRRKLRENGKKGGNPSLSKQTKKDELDNQQDKPTETRDQKLEARKKKEKRASAPSSYSLDFEDFWRAYPDRTNNSKPNAFAEWKALNDEDRQAAIAALVPFARFLKGKDAPPCVHAERFLRQRRFDSFAEQAAPVEARPVELGDSAEHRFLAECRADGATGWQQWVRGGFTVEALGDQTICVVTGPLHSFEEMGKATAKRLGFLVWNDAFFDKRKAKEAA